MKSRSSKKHAMAILSEYADCALRKQSLLC
jgi:hypothetical protein